MSAVLWWVIYSALVVIPFWKILPRYDIPAYAALGAVFPLLAVGLLWLIAFSDKLNLSDRTDEGER